MNSVMKVVVIFAVIIAVVLGDNCTTDHSCKEHGITHCEHHTLVRCEKNFGQCICVQTSVGKPCTLKGDCYCEDVGDNHCIDGVCQCRDIH